MSNRLRPADNRTVFAVLQAITALKVAREHLRFADCPKALAAVRSTIKKTEGALRHAQRRVQS